MLLIKIQIAKLFATFFSKEATSIHIEATSTQISNTYNIHGFFGLLLSVHRCWCH